MLPAPRSPDGRTIREDLPILAEHAAPGASCRLRTPLSVCTRSSNGESRPSALANERDRAYQSAPPGLCWRRGSDGHGSQHLSLYSAPQSAGAADHPGDDRRLVPLPLRHARAAQADRQRRLGRFRARIGCSGSPSTRCSTCSCCAACSWCWSWSTAASSTSSTSTRASWANACCAGCATTSIPASCAFRCRISGGCRPARSSR